MTDSPQPSHLEPSELGTKSYWDDCYKRELSNHSEHPEDEGTIWFSDSGAEEKVLEFLDDLAEQSVLSKGSPDDEGTSFLDLGTGNGHLLFALRDEGWWGCMLGLDYSAPSIHLAKRIGQTKASQNSADEDRDLLARLPIDFQEFDILKSSAPINRKVSVLLDKGTFDAISLSSEKDSQGRRISEQYRARIKPFLEDGGLFLITSCNWTEEELRNWFEKDEGGEDGIFKFRDRIKYPRFRFGGREGQSVVTICFEKKSRP